MATEENGTNERNGLYPTKRELFNQDPKHPTFLFIPPKATVRGSNGEPDLTYSLKGDLCTIDNDSDQVILPRKTDVRDPKYNLLVSKVTGHTTKVTIQPGSPYKVRIGVKVETLPQIIFIPIDLNGVSYPEESILINAGDFLSYSRIAMDFLPDDIATIRFGEAVSFVNEQSKLVRGKSYRP